MRAAEVQEVAAERIREHRRARSRLVRRRTKVLVRTAIGNAETLSDNAMRMIAVVAVVHVECGLPRGAANQDGSAAQICRRVERLVRRGAPLGVRR